MTDEKICQIGKDIYIIDDYYYKKIRRLRISIQNMKHTIKEYTERIEVKKRYLDEIYNHIKDNFKKQI